MPPQPPVKTGVFIDKATGLNAVRFNSANYPEPTRVRELVSDSATKKDVMHEGNAAARLETVLGGELERIKPLPPMKGKKTKAQADFIFKSGKYAGKTVDFMFTDYSKRSFINYDIQNKSIKIFKKIIDHLEKADIVPLDYRYLDEDSQDILNLFINTLDKKDQDRILIIR